MYLWQRHSAVSATVAECRRRADTPEMIRRGVHPLLNAADEAGQIPTLRAIKSVQFIHYQVANVSASFNRQSRTSRGRPAGSREHLVIGDQDVRCGGAQHLFVGDQALFGHHGRGFALQTTDPEAGGHETAEFGIPPDHIRQPPCLVGCERVHRIDEDSLDSPPWPELRYNELRGSVMFDGGTLHRGSERRADQAAR